MSFRFSRKSVGLVGVVAIIAIAVAFIVNNDVRKPLVFSNNAMLAELWNDHKENILEPSTGRTLDKQRGNITTSEGQSYTMLRAVVMNDQAVFDRSWQWTKDNLMHEDDKLFSWKYGQLPDGSYNVLPEGVNAASDADVDIALALLQAYARWQDPKYLNDAKPLIEDIWKNEVVMVQGQPVLTANDVEQYNSSRVIVNPSYWATYSFKLFAKVDPAHNWKGLSDNSYRLLNTLIDAELDRGDSAGLVPDWVSLDRVSGAAEPVASDNLTTNYSYDAMRTPWRLALDYQWFGDPRAKETLSKMQYLGREWDNRGRLMATYTHDGKIVGSEESAAVYGGNMGYFVVQDPEAAKRIFKDKLERLYSPDEQGWAKPASYYDDNWVWFGMALYLEAFPNMTEF